MPKRLLAAKTWVFDLDNCLYPAECNLFAQIDVRMGAFISDLLGVDKDEARRIQKDYFHDYGTTLTGLIRHHGIEPDDYLEYVHEIDLSPVPKNPDLSASLAKLPGRKIIYTNGSLDHARRVLARIGIGEHFEAIHDVHAADYIPKPERAAMDALITQYEIEPGRAVMVEDLARNLTPASQAGMATVWVRTASEWSSRDADPDHIDHETDDLTAWLTELTDI